MIGIYKSSNKRPLHTNTAMPFVKTSGCCPIYLCLLLWSTISSAGSTAGIAMLVQYFLSWQALPQGHSFAGHIYFLSFLVCSALPHFSGLYYKWSLESAYKTAICSRGSPVISAMTSIGIFLAFMPRASSILPSRLAARSPDS